MKKVVNVGIGGRSFVIDEDAYQRLNAYLESFKAKTNMGFQTNEVMDELESRIAEIFEQELSSKSEMVNLTLVNKVIAQLGMPDGSAADAGSYSSESGSASQGAPRYDYGGSGRKFFRDPDNCVIGGVCSGLAAYFNIDILLVRILMVVLLLVGSAGFWIYIIVWIVTPKAETAAQKCEMRGWAVTAENLAKVKTFRRG